MVTIEELNALRKKREALEDEMNLEEQYEKEKARIKELENQPMKKRIQKVTGFLRGIGDSIKADHDDKTPKGILGVGERMERR